MKSFFLSCLLLTISSLAIGQQTATTLDGKTVILNDDGTWKYQDKPLAAIEFNDSLLTKYRKPTTAKTLLKSERTNHAIWYNSLKWSTIDLKPTESTEYVLKLKDKDGYCITVVEKIEMPLENFREVMLKNLRMRGAEAIEIINEDYRIVNGNRVLHIQFNASANGVKFSYLGYYYSNEKGTTQLLCYTSKNLFSEYKQEFENMLNGFSVIPE